MHRPAHRRDVQVLRGVAVALVIAAHAYGLPAGGWLGVDVFFVVSGFVITRSLVAEHDRSGRIDLVGFAARRVRRLLPAAVVVLSVTTACSWVFWYRPRATEITGDALASLLGAMNWHLARGGTDYFAHEAASPLQHFWSLSVEEQFYAVWPIVLVVLSMPFVRRLRHGRSTAVGLLALGALGVALVAGPLDGPAYFSTGNRAWELLLGALCALVRTPAWSAPVAASIRAVGTAVLLIGIIGADVLGMPTVPVVFGTAAILVAGDLRGRGRVSAVVTRPWTELGAVSYSAYLWHWPLLVAAAAVHPGVVGASVAVLAGLGLAAASTRWVERPFLRPPVRHRHRHRHRRLRRFILVVPVTVLAVSASTATVFDPSTTTRVLGADGVLARSSVSATDPVPAGNTMPFPDRRSLARAVDEAARAGSSTRGSTAELADAARRAALPTAMRDGGCLTRVGAPLRTCGSTSDVDVLLLGDSTTAAWSPTVVGALPSGTTHAVVTVASCSAVLPDAQIAPQWDAECLATKRALHDRVSELDPRVVVISSVAGEYRDHLGDLPEGTARTAWQRSVEQTVSTLRDDGRTVVVLSALQYGPDVRSCPDRLTAFTRCAATPTPDVTAKTAAERAASEHGGFPFVDASTWLCDTERRTCPAVVDGTLVRVDYVHTTNTMAERLVPVMRSAVDWEHLLRG
ncbi:acyltransferase family protein [Curtobacterium sp. SP.BCo]|uniref:acyltransferase family protein n=1 Tax=Curtobacterium sp. SP.BCo TaxID=3435229 RepID=UPI003F733F4F